MDSSWHILYTKEGWENDVYKTLMNKKIIAFLPLYNTIKQRSLKKKNKVQVLFKSFVFVQHNISDLSIIKRIPGVINLIHWLDKPVKIADFEMNKLQRFLSSHIVRRVEAIDVSMESSSIIQGQEISNSTKKGGIINFIRFEIPFLGYCITAEPANAYVRTVTGSKKQAAITNEQSLLQLLD